ncbi:uridine kinase [Spiroplasma clarkii]|uniref:Uridine kinase n=1 Tax=Spiroplasma clarkii TaxID=2139 RepID=A0A1Y0L0V9_9MOLU|nr:uridine kinase [Spiroplasma clarkii]ARU91621.1 uridine kinase [Spiroplasma clarkii]ATX71018.1 uridine kinase [Spiroplasma clarkii]
MKNVTIIIIAGGSASGKTNVALKIANEILEGEPVVHVSMDHYYKSFANLSFEEKQKLNFDHPSTLDIDLLCQHLDLLKQRKPIDIPIYDFTTHSQTGTSTRVEPSDVVILDGILSLHIEEIRKRGDIRIFIRTDDDIRFIRHLQRDTVERGRSVADIIEQYLTTVRPSYKYFVETSIDHADIIVPYSEYNTIAVDMIATKIKSLLRKN